MNQVEFEKRREAMVKAISAFGKNQTIKAIDLIEILLEREPGDIIVLPDCFLRANQLRYQGGT